MEKIYRKESKTQRIKYKLQTKNEGPSKKSDIPIKQKTPMTSNTRLKRKLTFSKSGTH